MHERCNMLWIGPALGPVERACIRSVLRQGHPLSLWCYRPPAGVPEGVRLADARDVVPEDRIIRYRTGSVALFSNWFRYELQRRGAGIWLDADIYLLKPIHCGEYLMTRQDPATINCTPLRLPQESPMLPPLLALFDQKTVPRWVPLQSRIAARFSLIRTGKIDLASMPWGVAGPSAVTALAKKYDLAHLASPVETFHPFSWTDADWIRDPDRNLEERVTENTIGIHLWNELIKRYKGEPARANTFLARLQREGD